MMETKSTIHWVSLQGKFFWFFKYVSIQTGLRFFVDVVDVTNPQVDGVAPMPQLGECVCVETVGAHGEWHELVQFLDFSCIFFVKLVNKNFLTKLGRLIMLIFTFFRS